MIRRLKKPKNIVLFRVTVAVLLIVVVIDQLRNVQQRYLSRVGNDAEMPFSISEFFLEVGIITCLFYICLRFFSQWQYAFGISMIAALTAGSDYRNSKAYGLYDFTFEAILIVVALLIGFGWLENSLWKNVNSKQDSEH